ncbi:hypothetical protein DMENIID0001_127220 [Sergentomyia squamirostris]
MTPPEMVCPAPPPPPQSLSPEPTNKVANGTERANLLQDIRKGATLKKTPKLEIVNGNTPPSPHISNGLTNGNSIETPVKPIKSMDRVQVELNEHFQAKENGTLRKKPPAVQPIVKRLLTQKPSSESAQKENSDRLMLSHGKRNFSIKKASREKINGVSPSVSENGSREESPEPTIKPEKQTVDKDCPDAPIVNEATEEIVVKKPPVGKLTPLKIPPADHPVRPMSPDIAKIIKSPPMSPMPAKLKINHGKPNYTLPRRLKSTTDEPRRTPLEFMTMKLRQTPNSPCREESPFQEPPKSTTPSTLPFRSVTLGCKKENPPPSPLVPAAPTYETPKFDQKIVVSFAMDLAATPNRYPDHVKVTPQRTTPDVPSDMVELRQKKFTIDPTRLSVREQ